MLIMLASGCDAGAVAGPQATPPHIVLKDELPLPDGRKIVYFASISSKGSGTVPGTLQTIANCERGLATKTTSSVTYSSSYTLGFSGNFDVLETQFSQQYGVSVTLPAGSYTIPAGTRQTIKVWAVREGWGGWVVAGVYEKDDEGDWVPTGVTDQRELFYYTYRWDSSRTTCHEQGRGG